MNDNHRKLLKYNIPKLVDITNYEAMITSCLNKRIITDVMAGIIENDGKNEHQKKKLLFEKLVHRGPTAFQKLLDVLKDNNYTEAIKLLSSSTIPSATFSNECVVIDDNYLSISGTTGTMNSHSPPIVADIRSNNLEPNLSGDQADATPAKTDGSKQSRQKSSKLEPYTESTSYSFEFKLLELQVKRAVSYGSHPKLPVYNMKTKKRGVFFFVNIINFKRKEEPRNGADKDRENLVTLFREMGFTVFYYEDLTCNEFFDLINELKTSEHVENIDSFFFCIQTHGELLQNRTMMEFTDGAIAAVEDVINIFSNTSCKSLVNKPKVFFFPFCRGGISDTEKKIGKIIETDGIAGVPSFSDILICYGTVPGFQTHRDPDFGSWYVREMCSVFAEHASDCHIEELLKMVGSNTLKLRASGRLQVASTETRGFNKLLFLNPKIFD